MANTKKNTFETKKLAKKAEKTSFSMTPDLLKNNIFDTKPDAAAAKKPLAPVGKPAAPAPSPAVKPSAPVSAVKSVSKETVTPEQRYKMIEEAAYYRAEKNGFKGNPAQYWSDAEAEIQAMLARK